MARDQSVDAVADAEYKAALEYFKKHPHAQKWSKADSHYSGSWHQESDGTLYKIIEAPKTDSGKGSFGRVKRTTEKMLLKIQVVDPSRAASSEHLRKVKAEATINVELGIANHPATLRERYDHADPPRVKEVKVYQRMYDLGQNLEELLHVEIAEPLDAEGVAVDTALSRAIQLCIAVDDLHHGRYHTAGALKPGDKMPRQPGAYAHRDIKPANLTIDHTGRLFLIDFGTASTALDEDETLHFSGTPAYAPVDIDDLLEDDFQIQAGLMHVHSLLEAAGQDPKITSRDQDRIATLRTICYDRLGSPYVSIFDQEICKLLPTPLLDLLDTSSVVEHLMPPRNKETTKFFAAVLIHYQKTGTLTQADIDRIRDHIALQDSLVASFDTRRVAFPTAVSVMEAEAHTPQTSSKPLVADESSSTSDFQDLSSEDSSTASIRPLATESSEERIDIETPAHTSTTSSPMTARRTLVERFRETLQKAREAPPIETDVSPSPKNHR